jgi:hypothetical protein
VGLPAWKDVLATYAGYAYIRGKDASSREIDPLFVNAPMEPSGYDRGWSFALATGSPAMDAGKPVTVATSSGSNTTTLTVDDAYFFCDGFGAVEGDAIMIGGGTSVRITAIDFSSNTISIASPRTWTAGDGVHIAYTGLAPDIGASEQFEPARKVSVPGEQWRAFSLPMLPANRAVAAVLRDSSLVAFHWDNSAQAYGVAETFEPGEGYFLPLTGGDTNVVTGTPIGGFSVTMSREGWVLLGSLSVVIPASAIQVFPPDAVNTPLFRYDPAIRAFTESKFLVPGNAYWVHVTKACFFLVP